MLRTGKQYYYYIDKLKDGKYMNGDQITFGPYTKIEFEKLSSELNLSDFEMEFR